VWLSVCASLCSNVRRPSDAAPRSGKIRVARRNARRRSARMAPAAWKSAAGMASAAPRNATPAPQFGRTEWRRGSSKPSAGAFRLSSPGSPVESRRCSMRSPPGKPAPRRDCSFPPSGCRAGIPATRPMTMQAVWNYRLRNAIHPKPDHANPHNRKAQNLKPAYAEN